MDFFDFRKCLPNISRMIKINTSTKKSHAKKVSLSPSVLRGVVFSERKIDTYSYKGWIISDSFIKRSFASMGYHFMGMIFVYLIITVI